MREKLGDPNTSLLTRMLKCIKISTHKCVVFFLVNNGYILQIHFFEKVFNYRYFQKGRLTRRIMRLVGKFLKHIYPAELFFPFAIISVNQ